MSDLQQTLRDLHSELGQAQRLDPEDRAMLETVLGDIQHALESAETTPTESQRDPLKDAAVKLDAEHPGVAGAIRAVLDALSKAGI